MPDLISVGGEQSGEDRDVAGGGTGDATKTEVPLSAKDFLQHAAQFPIVDVRTPAEYLVGHIPGALSLPLFSDAERAEVGTMYKQEGRKAAILLGLDRVGIRLRDFAESLEAAAQDGTLLMHCWRGGMRSASLAWMARLIGLSVYTLEGGYKAYRSYVRETFALPFRMCILGGRTGSGKTEILQALQRLGEQTIDLEGLACHRGSAFGALGLEEQPGQEMFENELSRNLQRVDTKRDLWLEDESRNIGRRELPAPFYKLIRESGVIAIDSSREIRCRRLSRIYGSFSVEDLSMCLESIRKRLGGERLKEALAALGTGDRMRVCEIALDYYDRAYDYGLSRRDRTTIKTIRVETEDPDDAAKQILEEIKNGSSDTA